MDSLAKLWLDEDLETVYIMFSCIMFSCLQHMSTLHWYQLPHRNCRIRTVMILLYKRMYIDTFICMQTN